MESETVNIRARRYEVEITSGKIVNGEFKFALVVVDDEGNEVTDLEIKKAIAARLRESHKEYVSLARHEMMPGNPKRKIASALEAIMNGETFVSSESDDD